MVGSAPMRDHLEQVGKTTGKFDERLNKQPPPLFVYLWTIFTELHNTRKRDQSLSYCEIKAWSELSGISLTPEEVTTIKTLDNICLRQLDKGQHGN